MSELSKLETLLQDPSDTKVPRLNICRSIISLGKIKHQKWRNHLFSQRNKITKRAMEVEAAGGG